MQIRENLCFLLWGLALFATARACVVLIKWALFSATEAHVAQPAYSLILAAGLWWAWRMARRLPAA